ncbi:MAG: YDG domain-containing protein, partial [Clostridia bacterium]|nr:YDG domain-containing protein [Clostridia bacterium]
AYATYQITLGTIAETDNLIFVLETDTYKIYITPDNAVILSLKEGKRYETPYGQHFDPTNIIFDSEWFDVSGAVLGTDFDDISWYPSVAIGGGSYPNVGAYEIELTNIKLMKGASEVTQIDGHEVVVVVEPLNLYVVPAVIVVEPIASVETKVYAELDTSYGIGYQIVSIGGIEVNDATGYAGSTLSYINSEYVRGSYARAIYDKDGNFIAFGSKNDTVSDINGVIAGSDNFYSYAILNQFVSVEANGNFVVQANINTDSRLAISKARINVTSNDFDGVDKVYDGNTDVRYITTKACDLNGKLAVATDDVEVSFVAVYQTPNGAGDDSAAGRKNIVFSSLGLTGAQACNYDLYLENILVDSDTTFTIIKKLNGSDINILAGTISLIRSDFTVSKPYDNLVTLDKNSVSIINRADANSKGTSILYGVKDNMQVLYGVYPDKEVSKNYIVDIELFFPLGPDASESTIAIEQADASIDVSLRTVGGVLGVRVYIQGLAAEISKRVLRYESFSEIKAIDRDYNADSDLTFEYTLASGAAAAGDEAFEESNSIIIKGKTKNDETDVGTYETVFTGYSIDSEDFAKRYEVDIISLNNYYTGARQLEVTINPAKLMPRVEFISKVYDGSTNTSIAKSGENQRVFNRATADTSLLTTLNYAEKLLTQLKSFSYVFDNVTFAYALKGVLSGNVQADEDGNVVLHNVMVSGLTITEDGANNYLKNYTIYGGRYNSTTEEYEEIGAITSGVAVEAYEMFNVAGITKRKLQVKANDVEVPDKVYDGTKEATVSATLTSSDAIEEDKEYLEVKATATYARKQVGNNINVSVVITSIDVKAQYKETNGDLINNYDVSTFKLPVQRNILARPVDFSVSFKDRIYDGHETIAKNLIKYDLGSMLGDDAKNYSISTDKGAYYLTKDVEYTEYSQIEEGAAFNSAIDYYQESAGEYTKAEVTSENFAVKLAEGLYIKEFIAVEKLGTAYNPILFNSKEKYINYELSVKTDTPVIGESFYAYEVEDGTIYYGTGALKLTTATDEFDPAIKYYSGNIVDGAVVLTEEATLNASVFGPGYYYVDNYINVTAYYYHMPTVKKYVTKTAYDALTDPEKETVMNYAVGS